MPKSFKDWFNSFKYGYPVTNRTRHYKAMGSFPLQLDNPKYPDDMDYEDPRNEEAWVQDRVDYISLFRDLHERIAKLENAKEDAKDTREESP